MCGIVGSFHPSGIGKANESVLLAMCEQMVHRGPDGGGIWFSPNQQCALAHRRLSIIDLSEAASQPMINRAGNVAIVFNGEIYNHAEIRRELIARGWDMWATDHSDTEVLLRAYEEWGLACLKRLYGMFAFAVYDARDRGKPVVHLCRDRMGVKPLYVTKTKAGEWLFSSEIRAFFVHPDVIPEMDRTAFWHYLTFIVTPPPLTLFRGIFKLPAGHYITIDSAGRGQAQQWYDCVPEPSSILTEKDISEPEAIKELTRLLQTSIQRRMVSDVPFGVLLSGGVDSSLNVALMTELMERPVKTFTIGYEGKEDYNEFQFAKKISKRYRTDHHEAVISQKEMQDFLPLLVQLQDEPIADNVCIPLYFLAKLVKESSTTVVQVGEGADENFLGYWWCAHYADLFRRIYQPARNHSKPRKGWLSRLGWAHPRLEAKNQEETYTQWRAEQGQELFWGGAVCWWGQMREQLTPHLDPFRQKIECPIENLLPDSFRELDSAFIPSYFLEGLSGKFSDEEVLHKIPYMERKLRLPEHLLMRVDKLTMAHSVEARVPFLDHDVVEFASRLPSKYKLNQGTGKYLLKRVAEPYMDRDLIYRKKQGFGAPMEEWFQEGDFGKRCVNAFDHSSIKKEGFLDNQYVFDLLKHQMTKGGGYSFHLWTIINAVLWHSYWVESQVFD